MRYQRLRVSNHAWKAWEHQTEDGAVESEQQIALDAPVVEFAAQGAARLGEEYWQSVERATLRLVRPRRLGGRLELRVLGRWPLLLGFRAPDLEAGPGHVRCSYPIAGGALARRAAGEISFVQTEVKGSIVLRSTIRGFFPTLAAEVGRPHWTGALYTRVQSRLHVAISRRYFARLIEQAAR